MRTLLLSLMALLALPFAASAQWDADHARPGLKAPEFTATDSRGKTIALKDFLGKTVVLEWKNHLCPFVQKHYESGTMQALQKDLTKQGVVWLSVISSAPGKQGHVTPEEANAISKKEEGAPTAILMDAEGKIGRLYGAKTTPHMFVINPAGVIVYAGAIDDKPSADKEDLKGARSYVREAVEAVRLARAVEVESVPPYGCSVKYDDAR